MKQGLKKGSELFMIEDGVSLKIAAREAMGGRGRVEVDMSRLDDMRSARYCIWTYYIQGAGEIVVKSREVLPADKKKQLRELRLDLPGLEIMSEDAHTVVFVASQQDVGRRLDDIIVGMQNIALSAHRDAMQALIEGNVKLAAEVVSRESEILRSYRGMIRQLAICSRNPEIAYLSGIRDARELITYALLARDLNRIVYHAIYIARHFIELGKRPRGREILRILTDLSKTAYSMQKLAVEAFLEKNFTKALRVTKMMDEVKLLEKTANLKILNNLKVVEKAVTLMLIARELRRIAGYSVAISDAAVNRTLTPM